MDDWKEGLPEDIRDNTAFEGIDSIENLAKQHIEHLQYQGNSLRLPPEGASEDATRDFLGKIIERVPALVPKPDIDNEDTMGILFKAMGRPDKASEYDISDDSRFENIEALAALAHDVGLSQRQFQSLASGMVKNVLSETNDRNIDFDKDIRTLKLDWGIKFEDNVELAKNTLKATKAPEEFVIAAADGKLPASTLRWLSIIGTQLGAEGVNLHGTEETTRISPKEAKRQIDAIMDDKDHAYWHAEKGDAHMQAREKIDLLHEAAYG